MDAPFGCRLPVAKRHRTRRTWQWLNECSGSITRMMADFEPSDFLWFGAFETTAVLTALLVGAYSFLYDPTGRQDTEDVLEVRVYTVWRRRVMLVFLDIVLKIVVLAVQFANQRPLRTVLWTLALMLAPWAPFFGKVVAGFCATRDVHRMMCSRTARNELASVMREFLMFGHHSLSAMALAERLSQATRTRSRLMRR